MKVFFLVAIALAATAAHASEQIPIDDKFLVGWSSDGSHVAYERSVGLITPFHPEAWHARYIVVLDSKTGLVQGRYQLEASTSTRTQDPKQWGIFRDAQSRAAWDHLKPKFSMGNAMISNGQWTLTPRLTGDPASLEISTGTANGYDGSVTTERTIPGTVLSFEVSGPHWMQENGKWDVHFDVVNGSKSIAVHQYEVSSSTYQLSGVPDGYLAAYWAPNGDGVALEWTHGPFAGGGEWTDLFYRPLPK